MDGKRDASRRRGEPGETVQPEAIRSRKGGFTPWGMLLSY